MSTPTLHTPDAQPPAKPTARGFGPLKCPECGADAIMRLDLDHLCRCTCDNCAESFTLDDVRAMIAQWQKVLAWVDLCPAKE